MEKLLLLHGALGSKEQLEQLQTFLDTFETVSINFSGHGGEEFLTEFNINQFSKEVIQFLDENNIDKIDVFGYSMGGYVALYVAKYHSDRIGKIITLGTKFKWNSEIAEKEIKMLNADVIELKILAFANILQQRHQPNDWKELLAKTADMMVEMGNNNPLQIADYNAIQHKVKIGLADEDEMVSKEETLEVVNALKNSSFYTLANSKHPIEKIDISKLALEIKEFLG